MHYHYVVLRTLQDFGLCPNLASAIIYPNELALDCRMPIKLRFLGAAENVTGSCYLIEANGMRVMVDCGLYQEREYRSRNWDPFLVPPESIDALLLTHAHLDHSGLIPKLAREGFRGPIYATSATCEIAQITLLDSAHIQEEDAEFKRKRHEREGRKGPYPDVPLYTTKDATACFHLFTPIDYNKPVRIGKGITATFYDAGHILGSSMIKVTVTENGPPEVERTILFSGDVGHWDIPILRDPTIFDQADYVLMESTYGDRLHESADTIGKDLAEVINSTARAGGNIVVPSFAVERAQEVLYYLNELLMANQIPHLIVFLDSPMAVNITEVYKSHAELLSADMKRLARRGESPFAFPGLKLVSSIDESKAINHISGTVMIIAGSGMCTGGRIKHHLVANISRLESTILFVGYQAVGTLGRQILDGAAKVRILGQMYEVKAHIARINGFSGHADRDELVHWLSGFQTPPRHLFVVHGESEVARHFAGFLKQKFNWPVSVPQYQEEVILD